MFVINSFQPEKINQGSQLSWGKLRVSGAKDEHGLLNILVMLPAKSLKYCPCTVPSRVSWIAVCTDTVFCILYSVLSYCTAVMCALILSSFFCIFYCLTVLQYSTAQYCAPVFCTMLQHDQKKDTGFFMPKKTRAHDPLFNWIVIYWINNWVMSKLVLPFANSKHTKKIHFEITIWAPKLLKQNGGGAKCWIKQRDGVSKVVRVCHKRSSLPNLDKNTQRVLIIFFVSTTILHS